MSRAQVLLLLIGFAFGAVAGATLAGDVVSSAAHEDAAERAACTRALFRVTERALGHDEAMRQWCKELGQPEQRDDARLLPRAAVPRSIQPLLHHDAQNAGGRP
jgi:hypothetical protein